MFCVNLFSYKSKTFSTTRTILKSLGACTQPIHVLHRSLTSQAASHKRKRAKTVSSKRTLLNTKYTLAQKIDLLKEHAIALNHCEEKPRFLMGKARSNRVSCTLLSGLPAGLNGGISFT